MQEDNKPKTFIFIGRSGCGKGTQSELFLNKFREIKKEEPIYYLESGKNFREFIGKKTFEMIVGESVRQTFVRSINTSMTTILALIVLYFLGAEATKHFALALIIGVAVGTYSSIFIASALLVTIEKIQKKA